MRPVPVRSGSVHPLGAAARVSASEFTAVYTWWSWTGGWLVRAISQALLYGLLGRMLGAGHARYLFIGGAVLVCATESVLVCASTVNERRSGVLTLMVSSPAHPFPVLLGHGAQWLPGGVLTSLSCLALLGPAFGVSWTGGRAVATVLLVVLTSVGMYCVGFALGIVVLAHPELRNVAGTFAASSLAVVSGVAVPLAQWPVAIRAAGHAIPLTFTLDAIRTVLDGGPSSTVLSDAACALVLGALWLGAAGAVLRRYLAAARASGSLDWTDAS